jgi:hypothetical protein
VPVWLQHLRAGSHSTTLIGCRWRASATERPVLLRSDERVVPGRDHGESECLFRSGQGERMPRSKPLPDYLAGAAFSVVTGRDVGLSRGRMRGADLARPFTGVRAPASIAPGISDLALAYSTRMPARAFFSHVTAARLWGIPLPLHHERAALALDVSVPSRSAVLGGSGVTGHHISIDPDEIVRLGTLRLTSPARTWCDLGAVLGHEDLVVAGDALLWRRRPASSRVRRADLEDAIERFEGRRGRPALRAALPLLSDRSDSRAESIIRYRILAAGLPDPEVNHDLFDSLGRFIARPDLSFGRYRVSLDYEGDHHRTDAAQWEKDIARATRIENASWKHLRAGRADLRDTAELISNLELRLRAQGWTQARRAPRRPSRS